MLTVDVANTFQVLSALLEGREIAKLRAWIAEHPNLFAAHPFREVACLARQIGGDEEHDGAIAEELVQLCRSWQLPDRALASGAGYAQILQGLLDALLAGSVASAGEAQELYSWLEMLPAECLDVWPFCDLQELLIRVLGEGQIDARERLEMQDFARMFDLKFVQARTVATHLRAMPPQLHSIHRVANPSASIPFSKRTFCFTGLALAGQRQHLAELAKARGAAVVCSVTPGLDTLVVGDLSNPLWTFSTYGHKVQAVLDARHQGARTEIVMEGDFLLAARNADG